MIALLNIRIIFVIYFQTFFIKFTNGNKNDWLNYLLPDKHFKYLFFENIKLKKACQLDKNCPYKNYLPLKNCWGYEKNCDEWDNRFMKPSCPTDVVKGWAENKKDQIAKWYNQGDFGYVKSFRDNLKAICLPSTNNILDSALFCSENIRYCSGKNLFIDFRNIDLSKIENRFEENLLKIGEIGGRCKFYKNILIKNNKHKSALQSWYAELENYRSLSNYSCDIVFKKPVVFMKLDSGVNLYHHFCDFLNLYATFHVNGSFDMDIEIIMWDTTEMKYGDLFYDTWKAFNKKGEFIYLNTFQGKRVCFEKFLFSLLPRMRYGLFYNTPLIPGCNTTGMFRAFSEFLMYRLNITQTGPIKNQIRITLLVRKTQFRRILNEDELIRALKTVGEYKITVVDYNHKMPFLKQINTTHNTDILIGMHGAGLTHLLFLPSWAAIFELYNCQDADCYKELASLRGVYYTTWERSDKVKAEDEGKHPSTGEPHAKFTNYFFDVSEFMKIVRRLADTVLSNKEYLNNLNNNLFPGKDEL